MERVDMFTMIHKGLRALLFELAAEAARVDPSSTAAIDALCAKIERVLGFFDEHAALEDAHAFVALRTVAPALASSLAAEHRTLDLAQREVEHAAELLALAPLAARGEAAAQLARRVNRMTSAHLAHMDREETEANGALWDALDDAELGEVRRRLISAIPPPRYAEWMAMVAPALDPVERRRVVGGTVG
jgi:hypothetical protein